MIQNDGNLDKELKRYLNWLKSEGIQGTEELTEENFIESISDGVILLKCIELIQEGLVDWTRVNIPAKNKFKKMGNCTYVISLMEEDLNLTLTGVGGRDIVDGNIKLLFGVLWLLMRESYIALFGHKTDEEVQNWADGFLEKNDHPDFDVLHEKMDELPYAVVLYRGEEGEIFMGDDVELLDCPLVPVTFSNMVSQPCSRGTSYLG